MNELLDTENMQKVLLAVRRELEFAIMHNVQSYNLESLYGKIAVDITGPSEITVNVNTDDPDYGAFLEYGTGMYNEAGAKRIIEAKHRTASGKKGFLMFPVPTKSPLSSHPKIPGNIAFRGKNKKGEDVIFTQAIYGMISRPYIRPSIHKTNWGKVVQEALS